MKIALGRYGCGCASTTGRRATLIDLYHLEALRQAIRPEALPAVDRARLKAAALPVIFPGFTEAPWTGRPGEGIEVVGYDPDWPPRFRQWRDGWPRPWARRRSGSTMSAPRRCPDWRPSR